MLTAGQDSGYYPFILSIFSVMFIRRENMETVWADVMQVYPTPTIGVLSTGDELTEPTTKFLSRGQVPHIYCKTKLHNLGCIFLSLARSLPLLIKECLVVMQGQHVFLAHSRIGESISSPFLGPKFTVHDLFQVV